MFWTIMCFSAKVQIIRVDLGLTASAVNEVRTWILSASPRASCISIYGTTARVSNSGPSGHLQPATWYFAALYLTSHLNFSAVLTFIVVLLPFMFNHFWMNSSGLWKLSAVLLTSWPNWIIGWKEILKWHEVKGRNYHVTQSQSHLF